MKAHFFMSRANVSKAIVKVVSSGQQSSGVREWRIARVTDVNRKRSTQDNSIVAVRKLMITSHGKRHYRLQNLTLNMVSSELLTS